jgi:hypothetical protein
MIENIIALLLVAAALVYTIVWLRKFARGESKCVCGTNSCGCGTSSCASGGCSVTTSNEAAGLPLLKPPCGQGSCGKR